MISLTKLFSSISHIKIRTEEFVSSFTTLKISSVFCRRYLLCGN